MTHRLMIGLGCALVASSMSLGAVAFAQTADPAVFRPQAAVDAPSGASAIQLVQDRGGADRDRSRRGERMNRDEDEDEDGYFGRGGAGGWRPGMLRQGMGQGGLGQGMMSHALGGARIHLRRGDSAVNVRCPSDVRLNECIDAVGRLLDRLSSMGTGSGSGSGAPPPSSR